MLSPHLCLVVQGEKHIVLGNENYIFDNNSFVLSAIDLPIISKITQASNNKPYLGLTLELDLEEIAQMLIEVGFNNNNISKNARGISVNKLSEPLFEAVQRLVKLLEKPNEIPIMSKVIKKEIYYRLLTDTNEGYKLKEIISIGSKKNKIAKAVYWIKDNFDKPLHIKPLSEFVGMSHSTLYHHFKLLTGMSPIQYQKKIRLNESKKLMLVDNLSIGDAAFNVGYGSLTQFNREYKRLFGNPPKTDIKQLKNSNL